MRGAEGICEPSTSNHRTAKSLRAESVQDKMALPFKDQFFYDSKKSVHRQPIARFK
jgi:hypothetical protein